MYALGILITILNIVYKLTGFSPYYKKPYNCILFCAGIIFTTTIKQTGCTLYSSTVMCISFIDLFTFNLIKLCVIIYDILCCLMQVKKRFEFCISKTQTL